MKLIIRKIVLILFLLFFGCENLDVVETKIEFKEKIVVRAELILASKFEGVRLTRTLPIDEEYDISKAEIKNALSYLKINDVQVIPLHYEKDGLYIPKYSLVFEAGSTVELFADVKGKSVYGKTIIPHSPSVNRTLRENDYVFASVKPKPQEAYGAIWIISSGNPDNEIDKAIDFQNITSPSNFDSENNIVVRTSDLPESYLAGPYRDLTYIQIYSFDKAYLEYFKTKSNNRIVDNTFTQGGGSVAWNVYGDNVIGLFIGIAKGNKIKVN